MSRAFRKVSPRIWSDAKFLSLSDDGKLALLFLLTHPTLTSLGALRGNCPGLAVEIRWKAERLETAIQELTAAGIVDLDAGASFIALPNYLKHNPPENPNVIKSWGDQAERLPECSAKERLIERAQQHAKDRGQTFLKAFTDAFPEWFPEPARNGSGNGMPNPETETETETEPENKPKPEPETEGEAVSGNGRRPVNGFYEGLTEADLRDPAKVAGWYERAATACRIGHDERSRLEFHAAAVHARSRPAGEKVGNFIWTLGQPVDKRFINNAEEQTAQDEIAALRRSLQHRRGGLATGAALVAEAVA